VSDKTIFLTIYILYSEQTLTFTIHIDRHYSLNHLVFRDLHAKIKVEVFGHASTTGHGSSNRPTCKSWRLDAELLEIV
jgi:hypothetical protein